MPARSTYVNRRAGLCVHCREPVPAGDGYVFQGRDLAWRVAHHGDACVQLRADPGTQEPPRPRPRAVPPTWRPCGAPGCTPTACDDCDGDGLDPAASRARVRGV